MRSIRICCSCSAVRVDLGIGYVDKSQRDCTENTTCRIQPSYPWGLPKVSMYQLLPFGS